MKISLYKHIRQNQTTEHIDLDDFLTKVQCGEWEDLCHKIRNIEDPEIRKAEKAKCPYVTVSGLFAGKRNAAEITQHSGYLAIDIDKLGEQLEEVRTILNEDKYVYSCFMSISGTGLCAIFKINPEKHEDSFDGISAYLLSKYQIVIDPSGRDVCRPRYVSYDPNMTIKANCVTFREFLPKQKKREQIHRIFVQNEFDELIDRMVMARVNCCEDYRDWRNIGFAIADKFGEAGRHYFHSLSSISQKYDTATVDKQYTISLNRNYTGRNATIATLYWHAKQAGIPIFSPKVEQARKLTSAMKRGGLEKEAISKNLKEHAGIDGVDEVIEQVLIGQDEKEEHDIDTIATYIKSNYSLKRNEISRKIENGGQSLDDDDLNTMYLNAKKVFNKLNFELFTRIIFSDFTPRYNPIKDFISKYDNHIRLHPDALWNCIETNTPELLQKLGNKWLIGMVANVFGGNSPLWLILKGPQNSGKTRFFRDLLPTELRPFYAESKLEENKESDILLSQKLLIVDDEFGGKSKKESKYLKQLSSKDVITVRYHYGKSFIDVKRLATFGGTTNEDDIISDPTGNRRIIAVEISKIDFHRINAVDRIGIFMWAVDQFKLGQPYELDASDIKMLNDNTEKFKENSVEGELLMKYFTPSPFGGELTASEIKVYIEDRTRQKLSLRKLGLELAAQGFEFKFTQEGNGVAKKYKVVEKLR